MPADPIAALEARTMTEVVNDRYKPRTPLAEILFSGVTSRNLATETVQVDKLVGNYKMAPFVLKDGVPVPVNRHNFDSMTLETPCMKLKMPLTDSDLLLQRRAGIISADATGKDYMREAALEQISEDIDTMETAIELREEWMYSQLLRGKIEYEGEYAAFTVDLAKPAENDYAVPVLWNQPDARIFKDLSDAKKLITVDNHGPVPNIGLCGTQAAEALRAKIEAGDIKPIETTNGILAGNADLRAQWSDLGICFICRFAEIDFYEVPTQYVDEDGTTMIDSIRPDYIEIFSNGPTAKADRIVYYGRKRSMEALMNGLAIGRRFARSYIDQNADVYISEIQSRPLPWIKHPNWYVSLKVV
jgi:hypothetical protein